MTADLTAALQTIKLNWKATSMQILAGGSARNEVCQVEAAMHDGRRAQYQQVEQMEVLGSLLDGRGDDVVMANHRLHKAEQLFWQHSKALRGPATVMQKLQAWECGPSASACFDCSMWTINKTMLQRIRRWEFRWVRKMFGFRRRPDEGAMQFNMRTSRKITQWFQQAGIKMLHHRILRSIHRSAWREKEPGSGLGEKLLLDLRMQRSRIIWDVVKSVPLKRRRDENLVHSRTGNIREWEDVFIQHRGHAWRQERDSCGCRNDWDKSCNDFVDEISVAWNLPTMRRDADKGVHAERRPCHSAKSCAAEEPEIDQKLEIPWESSHDRFLFVVDCQPLQRVVCGQTALLNDYLRPLLHRVLDNLADTVAHGLLPPATRSDPVMWARRAQ